MKKYTKPTCEAMSLGLKGENIADGGISVVSEYATKTTSVDGGNALVKEERDWTDSSSFWGE